MLNLKSCYICFGRVPESDRELLERWKEVRFGRDIAVAAALMSGLASCISMKGELDAV